MSAEHRKPVMAFVLLAFVAAALVGIQRADAQGGRLMAAVIGGTVRVHGTLPTPSAESHDTSEAQALGPVFAALRAPEATVRPGHETRTVPTGAAATSVNVQRAVTTAARPVEERLTGARPAAPAKTVPAATSSATKPRPSGEAVAARDEKAADRAKDRAERAAAKAEKAAEKLRERASRAAERALDRARDHATSITRWGARDDHRRWQGRSTDRRRTEDTRSARRDRASDRSRRVGDWRDRDWDRSDRDRGYRDRSRRDSGSRDAGSRERRDRGDRSWGGRDRRDRGWDGSRSGRGSSRHGWNR